MFETIFFNCKDPSCDAIKCHHRKQCRIAFDDWQKGERDDSQQLDVCAGVACVSRIWLTFIVSSFDAQPSTSPLFNFIRRFLSSANFLVNFFLQHVVVASDSFTLSMRCAVDICARGVIIIYRNHQMLSRFVGRPNVAFPIELLKLSQITS